MNIEIVEELGGNFYNTNIYDYPCGKNYTDKHIEMFIQILKDFLDAHHTIKSICSMNNFRMTINNQGDIVVGIEMINQDTKTKYGIGCKINRMHFIHNDTKAIEWEILDTFHKLLWY